MGLKTNIEWCDSTSNLMMGCDGCELWIPRRGIRDCYAGVLTGRYAGKPGWPAAFDQPREFPDRVETMLRWPDLTGTARQDKPWLNGMPRLIFVDDMGDTFTESLDPGWLAPHIPRLAQSPHIFIFLTKRVKRMVAFWREVGDIPANVWLGTTVTGPATLGRLRDLQALRWIGTHKNVLWCSFEPLMAPLRIDALKGHGLFYVRPDFFDDELADITYEALIDWAVVGGGSHMRRMMQPDWAFDLLRWLDFLGIPTFFKQWGDLMVNPDPNDSTTRENGGYAKGGRMVDGRTLDEFPKVTRS